MELLYLTGAAVLDGTRNTIESTEFIMRVASAKETAQFMIRHNFHFAFGQIQKCLIQKIR